MMTTRMIVDSTFDAVERAALDAIVYNDHTLRVTVHQVRPTVCVVTVLTAHDERHHILTMYTVEVVRGVGHVRSRTENQLVTAKES